MDEPEFFLRFDEFSEARTLGRLAVAHLAKIEAL